MRTRDILRAWRPLAAIAALSPLVYLYMPLRERMGATWTFGQTRTWRGFWAMVLDTKADRIVHPPAGLAEWWPRARTVIAMMGDDLWWPLLALGLVGIFLPGILVLLGVLHAVPDTSRGKQVLSVFGQSALFYYIGHLLLYATVGALFFRSGIPLPWMYLVWLLSLVPLYWACRSYSRFKSAKSVDSMWRFF